MTQTEYEQKKRECWEEFCRANPSHNKSIFARKVFDYAFDRAYALGKEKETISQEEIADEAKDYAFDIDGSDWERQRARDGFVDGANFALGKQEKDADPVISGWVCRDNNSLNAQVLIGDKPKRTGYNYWENKSADCITLPKDLFPDLTWDSDPIECEITIKRKKNG